MNGKISLKESRKGLWVTYDWNSPWKKASRIKKGKKTNPNKDCDGYWLPETQKLQVRRAGVWLDYINFSASYADAGGRWYKIRNWSIKGEARVVEK